MAFNNLLLLGLDVEDVEARYGCSLDPSTFTASSCPQKPVEVASSPSPHLTCTFPLRTKIHPSCARSTSSDPLS